MSLLVSARTYQILWISCPSSEVMATFGVLGLEGRPDAPAWHESSPASPGRILGNPSPSVVRALLIV